MISKLFNWLFPKQPEHVEDKIPPYYNDEEWDQAHKENQEVDRAKAIDTTKNWPFPADLMPAEPVAEQAKPVAKPKTQAKKPAATKKATTPKPQAKKPVAKKTKKVTK